MNMCLHIIGVVILISIQGLLVQFLMISCFNSIVASALGYSEKSEKTQEVKRVKIPIGYSEKSEKPGRWWVSCRAETTPSCTLETQ